MLRFLWCLAVLASPLQASFLDTALTIRDAMLTETSATPFLKTPWVAQTPPKTTATYPWKRGIMTTVFWIGEQPAKHNPVPNNASSWDGAWKRNYGGYDCPDPKNRIGFRPVGFLPKQNPFYIALPYNDIGPRGTKSEAPKVIPWYQREFTQPGKSVVKGRWIAIHYKGRVCFAQWEDAGPFRTDHWQYVFGNERPSSNRNHNAGLDISPAVRDYLGMKSNDTTDWKFVEIQEIPAGPWTKYGENNPFSPSYNPNTPTQLADNSR